MESADAGTGTFRHEALFYRTSAEYLSGVLPFVREGLAAGERVVVAVPGPRLELVRSALGGEAADVRFLDMTVAGRNPGRIIPTVLHPFLAGGSGPGRAVGEPIWSTRSAAEYPPCVQHESLINRAFENVDGGVLCPYDLSALSDEAIADAGRTHPVLVDRAERWTSPDYLAPAAAHRAFNRRPEEPGVAFDAIGFDARGLAGVRRFTRDQAVRAGLPPARVTDLLIAVHEIAANVIEHGGGIGMMRAWPADGGLCCEITDMGAPMGELAGRIPPTRYSEHGRGLMMVNQVCDLVHIYTAPIGNTVRLHLRSAA